MYEHVLFGKWSNKSGQSPYALMMYEKTVESVAHAYTSCLAILYYAGAHIRIAKLIEISMHHTCTRLYNRYACRLTHKVNQASAATRDAEVYIPHCCQHLVCSLMSGRKQTDNILVYVMLTQHLLGKLNYGTVGRVGILASLQHTGIARLETKGEDIEADIRTRLVYNAHHSIGNTLLAQAKTIRKRLCIKHLAKRIIQVSHIAQGSGYIMQTSLCKLQAVVKRIVL